MLTLYNTKSGKIEGFIPQEPGRVKAYTCGPTVYDYCHIGHARTYINFDVLKRYLEAQGYEVIHVQNFTDIDDKITERAKKEGRDATVVADFFIEEYLREMDALNVKRATAYTRASEYIPQIVEITRGLLEKGAAYHTDGAVYFDVNRAGGFGELVSNVEGAVVDSVERRGSKRCPFDFVLWREAKEGEQSWESPWGRGRPGWHTECVAMSTTKLGDTLDIHWGGKDLVYPHHECESLIARAVTGKAFVRYWLHNEFVLIEGKKMSKSTGRSVYIRDLLKRYRAETLRTFVLLRGYRERINFSEEGMREAEAVYNALRAGALAAKKADAGHPYGSQASVCAEDYMQEFFSALDDDLHTGAAISAVERLSEELLAGSKIDGASRLFNAVESVLGLRVYSDTKSASISKSASTSASNATPPQPSSRP